MRRSTKSALEIVNGYNVANKRPRQIFNCELLTRTANSSLYGVTRSRSLYDERKVKYPTITNSVAIPKGQELLLEVKEITTTEAAACDTPPAKRHKK